MGDVADIPFSLAVDLSGEHPNLTGQIYWRIFHVNDDVVQMVAKPMKWS
jgi:hypothetical protein